MNDRLVKIIQLSDRVLGLNQFGDVSREASDKVDVTAGLVGGGFTGQTGAVVMGLARAILCYDSSLEPILREHGFLTRDARKVERKKYGQSGARRRFQFSKR